MNTLPLEIILASQSITVIIISLLLLIQDSGPTG
jgi:hypothetical protein